MFDKEELEAFEIGYKGELLDGAVRVNMAAFYYDQNDVQVTAQDPGDPVRSDVFNTDGESKGFEIEITGQLSESLVGVIGYAYTDAEQDEWEAVFNAGTPEEVVIVNEAGTVGAPENSTFATLNYSHDYEWGQLRANLSYSWTEAYEQTLGAEKSSREVFDARVATSWNVGETGELTLAVWGQNLLDDEYEADRLNFSIIEGFNAPDIVWFGVPRTYGIEASYRF